MSIFRVTLLLILFSAVSNANQNCGIEDKYLQSFSIIKYGISELAEKNNILPTDAGSVIISWDLKCEEESKDPDECSDIKVTPKNGNTALSIAWKLVSSKSTKVVAVGWANSNELDEITGLPHITASLYVPGYDVLTIQSSKHTNSELCKRMF